MLLLIILLLILIMMIITIDMIQRGLEARAHQHELTANLRTTILDFRGSDSSRVFVLRGGILMSIGDYVYIYIYIYICIYIYIYM